MRHKSLSSFGLLLFCLIVLVMTGGDRRAMAQEVPAANPTEQAPAPAEIAQAQSVPPVAAPATQPAASQPTVEPPTAPPAAGKIKFSFKGATFQQVIDFFSRETKLPVVWESPAPEGTLDYVSPREYELSEALQVLNEVLQTKGVMLRVDDQKLYLQKLDQMQKEALPTYVGKLPAEITNDQIVTLVYPLKIALAKPLAEKLAGMVASYGAVTAVDQQNALVITETAANIRRIQTILEQLDKDDVEGVIEIFKMKSAKATDLMKPLQVLLGTRVEKFIVNDKGQQIKIEENQMPGLTMSADERTNSIIAKGVQNQVSRLRDAIQLLDVPSAGQGRALTTLAVSRIAPADAVTKLTQLYQRIEEKARPTVLALEDAAKVMIVGDEKAVAEGAQLINELEGGTSSPQASQEPSIAVIALEKAKPESVIAAVTSLLNKRQQTALKLLPGTDGKSVIVSGRSDDVASVRSLLPILDKQATIDRQARLLRIANGDPKSIVEQARKVFDQQKQPNDAQMELSAELDSDSRIVTVIGTSKAIDAFTNAVKMIEANVVVDRIAKRMELKHVLPSELTGPINSLSQQLLQPKDGSLYIAPTISAVDQLNTLVVSGTPEQFTTLEPLIASLDVPPADAGVTALTPRVLRLRIADAGNLAAVLTAQYGQRSAVEKRDKPVRIASDPASNSLIVSAHAEPITQIESIVEELDKAERADLEGREIHVFPLKIARAEELAATIDAMFPPPPVPLDARGRPQPHLQKPREAIVRADRRTNSLIVATLIGSPVATSLTTELIAQLDVDPATMAGGSNAARSVRVITMQNADAQQLAANLDAMFSTPESAVTPPSVRVDLPSNSLLIRATDEQFKTIEQVVSKIDQATIASSRQMRTIMIDPSKTSAEEIANTLQKFLDRAGGGAGGKVQVITLDELLKRKQVEAKPAAGEKKQSMLEPRSGPDSLSLRERAGVRVERTTFQLASASPATISKNTSVADDATELFGLPSPQPSPCKGEGVPAASRPIVNPVVLQVALLAIGAMQVDKAADPTADVTIAVDKATNSLVIVGSQRAVERVTNLIKQIQDQIPTASGTIRYISMPATVDVQTMSSLIVQTLERITPAAGQVGDLRRRVAVIADVAGNALIIAANDSDFETVADLIAALSKSASPDFPIRTVTLQKAEASAVARGIQQFYDDRAKMAPAGQKAAQKRVSILAVDTSNTLLISASEEDFKQIEILVAQFDTAQAAAGLTFKVFQLQHARASEIERSVQSLVDDLTWNQNRIFVWPPPPQKKDTIAVRADNRLNVLIVTGRGDKFDVVEKMIEILDAAPQEGAQRVVKLYRINNAQPQTVADVVREVLNQGRSRRPWEAPDPGEIRIRVDENRNLLIVSATQKEQDDVKALIAGIDIAVTADAGGNQQTEVLPVKFARAADMANTLTRFLTDRARASNAPKPTAAIVATDSANTLVVAATKTELDTIKELLAQLDLPDVTGDRSIEILALQEGNAVDIARMLKEQFARRVAPGSGGAGAAGVTITADARTNSIIINAPQAEFAQAKALIEKLDAPSDSDETIIRTYALKSAQADQAVRVLTQTLQLDSRGQTPGKGTTIKLENAPPDAPAIEVKARVAADRRSNSLIVTATAQSFPIIENLISKLDEVPAANPQEWRIIPLKHAMAGEVGLTLASIMRNLDDGQPTPRIDSIRRDNKLIVFATPDQFRRLEQILSQMDLPSEIERVTDFVPLKFAQAAKLQEALAVFYGQFAQEADTPGKKTVRIVADPATNSLVISAEKSEWDGIRALLTRLDSAEYDSSLQLKVLMLVYADAQSVARAINDAFQTSIQRPRGAGGQANQPRPQGNQQDAFGNITMLVQADEWVRASAEPQTNTVIVSASRQNIAKVEEIVKLLDKADYAKLPPPQIIPVSVGDPMQLAQSLMQLYTQSRPSGPGSGSGFPPLSIVGNAAANSIIVRAEKEDFEQIKTLSDALQLQAANNGLSVNVLKMKAIPAARIAASLGEAYQAKAKQANQPLSIKVDPVGNNLIIASTAPLFEEIKTTAENLDAAAPAAGQSVFIIELQNTPPENAKTIIETIGLDKQQPPDSISRIVSEPIKLSLIAGRNAIIVVANPTDKDTVVSLLKAIDAEPPLAESQTQVIKLKHAQAAALANMLMQVLKPGDQQTDTPLAKAVKEQVRRLSVQRPTAGGSKFQLDLTKPIRIIPDPNLNALVVSSTYENISALEALVAMFDELPITDNVTVQIYPLQNISADQFARILKDLFTQGKQLGKTVLTKVAGVPEGAVGKALLNEIAITTDERTNTVIVAGTEDSVALVEVLSKRIDSGIVAGWVEPRIVHLRYADATDLAATLQAIVVEGTTNLPQSTPLQRQIGRLRMARMKPGPAGAGQNATQPNGQVLESDVFVPMTRLIIRPEPQMNALILIGTPDNIETISELVAMLDVEAASPANAVRIYPVVNASASRIAQTVKQLFDQQVASKAIRAEDRVIVQADERTNALVVATSSRSFAVLENLLKTLDNKMAPELREIRTIDVKNASASRLASIIQQMMDARMERLRKVQPETADLERATVVADARTNSLVIAAGNDTYEVIKRLAADLDVDTLADSALVQVLPLEKGNVERIAQAINQIMGRRYADMPAELRNSLRPLVMTDLRTNSLLVAANPEDLAAITDLVTKLAAAPQNPAVGITLIPLTGSTRAELIAPRVQKLMQERQASLGPAGTNIDRVSIEPDPASNSLIVAANEENLQIIRNLVEVLVQAEANSGAGREMEVVSLKTSRAVDMIDLLDDLYVREANRSRGPNTVRITAEERLNAVLINAPPADARALRDLIAQLDGAKPASVVEIKYVPLKSANAIETVSLIENVLSGRGIGTRRGTRQATVLKYLRQIATSQGVPGASGENGAATKPEDEIAPVEMEVSAAIRESITLTPDLRTNTIIVSAPRESITMIERMIRDLDDSSTGSKNVRLFKLVNADATAMEEILTELFKLRQGNNLYVLKPREDQPLAASRGTGEVSLSEGGAPAVGPREAASGGGFSGTELTAVPDERQQLSITVDSRTNTLIVSGTPTYLDLVAQVVEELDKLEANEREIYVYQLRNAIAADVAQVVGDFVEQEQKKLVGTLSPDQLGSATRLLEREITIQGDKQSNTVLVSASPRYMDRVKDMIKKLDVDPPQVLIQVMLAEVTLDSLDDWGVDMKIRASIDSTDINAGYGLATAFLAGLGVPSLAITSSDFDLLIRAMKSQGRLQVLSNPSIMAANNAPARIQVGETIRLPSSTSISDAGRTSSTLEKEDIGVILKVTPSINPDGFVRMTISPEISNLSVRTTQVSEDFESPIITRRTADTTVTVRDGQTIVIGGLISDRFEKRDRKVPFFGDLPFIGPLFRSNTEQTAKTELLIVLTPHVIDSPAAFDRVEQVTTDEIERLSLPQEVKDQIRRSLIDGTGGLYDASGNRIDVKDAEEKK